ncbi:MAG: trypsin-like peptidase domain-containing protein [Chitinophagales bacterium]
MKKSTIVWMLILLFSITKAQQTTEAMLDNALSAVISVGVFKAEATKQPLGYRGRSDVAYEKKLDLSDALCKGSGYVIDVNGKKYICTNAHVIENATNESGAIYVYSITGKKYEAKVKGGDSFYDYALLEFVTPPGTEITTIKYATDAPAIGQRVYAIGNPLAEYPYTVSDGIVSAKNRVREGLTGKYGYVQHTATIIWGNSGGPLVNEKGEVVGMNSYIAFGPEDKGSLWQPQINFALEAKVCRRLTDDFLTNNGKTRRAYLGIEVSQNYDVTTDYYTQKATLTKRDKTPVISNVFLNSPSAGLADKIGATIFKVNGVEVRNVEEVLGEFENIKPNTTVSLVLIKNGVNETVSIKATELQASMMGDLAKAMIQSDPSYQLTASDGGVYISFKKAMPTYNYNNREDRRYNRQENLRTDNGRSDTKMEYKVIGVGEINQQSEEVWRVGNTADLGTGIRFYGLAGFYDLVYTDKYDTQSQPQSTRVYLSGDQNVIKSTLWY